MQGLKGVQGLDAKSVVVQELWECRNVGLKKVGGVQGLAPQRLTDLVAAIIVFLLYEQGVTDRTAAIC
ncbi:hypothetical protein PAENIP36_13450 [Paenibacillus sp. P36]